MRLKTLVLLVVALLLVGTAPPAAAETRSLEDPVATVGEPSAPYDLRRVTWNYTSERFVVTSSRMGRSRHDVVMTVRAAHDWEGYEVVARSWWQGRRKVDRLWVWFNTIERTPVRCEGLRSRWRLNVIRVSIPSSCLFDGYPMRDFSVATSTADTSVILDEVTTVARLTSS